MKHVFLLLFSVCFVASTALAQDPVVVVTEEGNVGIGRVDPNLPLFIERDQDSFTLLRMMSHDNDQAGSAPILDFLRSRGNIQNPAVIEQGDVLGRIDAFGYDGDNYIRSASISFVADGPVTNAPDVPTRIQFNYTKPGVGQVSQALSLDSEGFARFFGSQIRLGLDDGLDTGEQGAQRALVHGVSDQLIINFNGDFEGGTRISSDLEVDGTIDKQGSNFKIDHPLDPANKYLSHSVIESPDMMNVYNGNISLDEEGKGWVELPDYFEALNEEFRYQLTPMGAPGPGLYIKEEINGNRFQIAGGTPELKVSWQVTGIRKDAYAQQNRTQVEQLKPENERGTYLYPKGFVQIGDESAKDVQQP